MVGLLERVADRVPSHFSSPGDDIIVLGRTRGALGGSAYWAEVGRFVGGQPAVVDLDAELRLQRLLVAAAAEGLLRSAHDCSEGGLLVTLAEAAIGGPYALEGLGASCDLGEYATGMSAEALLYGEDGARAVVSCRSAGAERLEGLCREHGVPSFRAGRVERASGELEVAAAGQSFTWSIPALRKIYFEAIPRRMRHPDVDRSVGA
jgi:phosphoribosylformylglycinamidine synthase